MIKTGEEPARVRTSICCGENDRTRPAIKRETEERLCPRVARDGLAKIDFGGDRVPRVCTKDGNGDFSDIIDAVLSSHVEGPGRPVLRYRLNIAVDIEVDRIVRGVAEIQEGDIVRVDIDERPGDCLRKM